MVDIELNLRVFSRFKHPETPTIEQVDQTPGVEIDEVVIIG
jgi:hypothetical protein